MKLALISDIHANLPALQAVLDDAEGRVDKWLCLGDIVGYYSDPNAVCELLRGLHCVCIRGNHDAYVVGDLEPNPARALQYRTEWTRHELSRENLEWLAGLPVERRIGQSVVIRHASPWDEETYLYPDKAHRYTSEFSGIPTLIVGHTHYPMDLTVGATRIINPGSVGQPRDGDARASYAILDTAPMELEFRRVAYDVVGYQALLLTQGWDERMTRALTKTRRP